MIPGSARVSRAGESVPLSRTFLKDGFGETRALPGSCGRHVIVSIQRVAFEQQFYHRHHHIAHRPGGGENQEGENKHLFRSFTPGLEQKLTREVVKSTLVGFSLIARP
jgi:hypothetical protein